jgi:hypothetical protein
MCFPVLHDALFKLDEASVFRFGVIMYEFSIVSVHVCCLVCWPIARILLDASMIGRLETVLIAISIQMHGRFGCSLSPARTFDILAQDHRLQ